MPSPFAEVLDSLRASFEALDAAWYVFGAQAALVHGAVRMTADLGGTTVPVAAAEDVVAMKILSGRPKDRDDVIAIIAAQGPALNHHRIRETLELLEKALDRSDLVAELERARTEATR